MHASELREFVITSCRQEHVAAFYRLNRAWLDEHELYEPADELQLGNPLAMAEEGGAVFVALDDDVVIGTAAVTEYGPGAMEIVKLTVAEPARGRGLGRLLADECVQVARRAGMEKLVLVSSTRLGHALRLYESMGFEHRPMPADVPYATADVYMELDLTAPRDAR